MSNGNIPDDLIEKYKEGVEKLTFFGMPVTELDRDGLLAALNCSVQESARQFESIKSSFEMNQVFADAHKRGLRI